MKRIISQLVTKNKKVLKVRNEVNTSIAVRAFSVGSARCEKNIVGEESRPQKNYKGMGLIYSLLGWTEEQPDPVLGITPREIKLVKNSWAKAMPLRAQVGAGIMMSLFDKYPEYKKYFPFKDVPDEELKDNLKFKVHCSTVVYSLGQIVDNLENTELVLGLLDKLVLNHIKHNTPPEGFLNIQGIIEDALKPITNDEEMKTWSKVLTVAMTYAHDKMVEGTTK